MDWRGIPSFNSLRAFSAVADTLNLSQAGRALNVSHAAVSQQVRALEAHLGTSLVVRHGRGVTLTPEGQELARSLEDSFQGIRKRGRRACQCRIGPSVAGNDDARLRGLLADAAHLRFPAWSIPISS
jgi:DNA-binding transcriptional LysR family regulator